jgi:NADH:ubiquinone oxidoreductase subunit C
MLREALISLLKTLFPDGQVREETQYPELLVPNTRWLEVATTLRNHEDLHLDFLISLTAVDYKDKFTLVIHMESTSFRHLLVVKTDLNDHKNPVVDSLSTLWPTAGFHEREVYDLFGIRFSGHTDMRRLFMEEGYGFPLRKDFSDESRVLTLS